MTRQITASEAGLDPLLVKAIGHPTRLDALRIFGERVASPNEVAKAIGIPVGNVSHHVRVLIECECIELVDEKKRRGAIEHYYRATERANVTDAISKLLPQPIREGIRDKMLGVIFERTGQALEAGTIDSRADRHISWMSVTLDEKAWLALVALKARQLDAEMEIEAEAADRIAKGSEDGFPVFTATMCFEAAPLTK